MIRSSIARMRSCSSHDSLGLAVREHLDLVELVHAEDAARVLAVRAGLAPEARGVAARSAPGSWSGVSVSPRCSADSGDLARADEEQLAVVDVVHLGAVGREEAGLLHRAFAHERRRDHRHEPVRDDRAHRVVHERELEQRGLAR